MTGWQPIAKLKDSHLNEDSMWGLNILFGNACNGPAHLYPLSSHGYFSAADIKREAVWDWFCILPEVPKEERK